MCQNQYLYLQFLSFLFKVRGAEIYTNLTFGVLVDGF